MYKCASTEIKRGSMNGMVIIKTRRIIFLPIAKLEEAYPRRTGVVGDRERDTPKRRKSWSTYVAHGIGVSWSREGYNVSDISQS